MSHPQGTEREVTEQEFIEALLSVIECAYKLAFDECDDALFIAAVNRRDSALFKRIAYKADMVRQEFAMKVLTHQKNEDIWQEQALLNAASIAAEASETFDKIVDDIETVKKYCRVHRVSSVSFETAAALNRALELGGRHRVLA